MHVNRVTMHVGRVAMHMDQVAMHVNRVAMHVDRVAMHVDRVAMHVDRDSGHACRPSGHACALAAILFCFLQAVRTARARATGTHFPSSLCGTQDTTGLPPLPVSNMASLCLVCVASLSTTASASAVRFDDMLECRQQRCSKTQEVQLANAQKQLTEMYGEGCVVQATRNISSGTAFVGSICYSLVLHVVGIK